MILFTDLPIYTYIRSVGLLLYYLYMSASNDIQDRRANSINRTCTDQPLIIGVPKVIMYKQQRLVKRRHVVSILYLLFSLLSAFGWRERKEWGKVGPGRKGLNILQMKNLFFSLKVWLNAKLIKLLILNILIKYNATYACNL